MKNKFLFSLLFIFLLSGFLFFKADFAFGADGMCSCDIYSTDTGKLITPMDDVSDGGIEVCDALEGTEPFEKQLYKNCLWQDTGAECICSIIDMETDEIIYEKAAVKKEAECMGLTGDDVGHYINVTGEYKVDYTFESCNWEGPSELKPIVTEGSTSLDLPSVSGLNQLKNTDVKVILGTIIKVGMGLIGSIALALFAYAGVLWMIARGNAEQGKKARDIMIWAVLGLFVILASYTIVSFIFSAVE